MSDKPKVFQNMYWHDFDADTSGIPLFDRGVYLILIKEYWYNGGPLPENKTFLYRKCVAISRAEKASVNRILEAYFLHENGVYRHPRIDRDLAQATEKIRKNRERAQKGAAARWQKTDATSNATSNAQALLKQCPSESESYTRRDRSVVSPKNVDNFGNLLKIKEKMTRHYVDNSAKPLKTFSILSYLTENELARVRRTHPRWDIEVFSKIYDQWIQSQDVPDHPFDAFMGWMDSYTKNMLQG